MTYNSNNLRSFVFPGTPGLLTLPAGIEVVRKGTSGVDYMSKFGHNGSVGTSEEPIWAYSGTAITYPSTAQSCTISSNDTDDASGGTGARTVYVEGLDGNYAVVSETKALNGQNGVALSNSYLRVYRAYVVTAGSQGFNDGQIFIGYGTVTGGVPANILATIEDEMNQTLQAAYTIPAGKTGYLVSGHATTSKLGEVLLYTRLVGELFRVQRRYTITDQFYEYFALPFKLPEKTDIEVRGLVGVAGGDMSASFDIILI